MLVLPARDTVSGPCWRAYISRAGYVRFAAKKYSLDDLRKMHSAGTSANKAQACNVSAETSSPRIKGVFDPFVHLTYINSYDQQRSAVGTWTLTVEDRAGADIGTLHSWTMGLNEPAPATP